MNMDAIGFASENIGELTQNIAKAQTTVNLPYIYSKENLLKRIDQSRDNLIGTYSHFWEPAKAFLKEADDRCFNLHQTGKKPLPAETIKRANDFAQAVLQHCTNFQWDKTLPLQQLVCDMWSTFVGTSGFCSTGHCSPPIVKWGEEEGASAECQHSVKEPFTDSVPIVTFPKNLLNDGILAWPVLMHETAHTILESGNKLSPQLTKAVERALKTKNFRKKVVQYWVGNNSDSLNKIDEAAADIMSVLYMGPLAAVGLLARFRANRGGELLTKDIKNDPHPADVLRILVTAYTVRRLDTSCSEEWFDFLIAQVGNDFDKNVSSMSWDVACESAECVADAIMDAKVVRDNMSLKQIRSWNQTDEVKVNDYLKEHERPYASYEKYSTPHIVAAANLYLLTKVKLIDSQDKRIGERFKWMIDQMKKEAQKGCNTCDLTTRKISSVSIVSPPPPVSQHVAQVPQWNDGCTQTQNPGFSTGEKILMGGIVVVISLCAAYLISRSESSDERNRGRAARRL